MIATSPAYKTAVVKGTRSTVAHISFGVYDVTAKDDAAPSANTSQPFSNITSILDNATQVAFNMATFEDDYFKLDGSLYLVPDDVSTLDSLGWWTQLISDANGEFTGTIPTVTILFDDNHSSLGIGLMFDSIGNNYCTEFDVTWYNGVTVLGYALIEDNTQIERFVDTSIENYDKIVIRFLKTNVPYRYVRFMDINFGLQEVFDNEEITAAMLVEELDPSCNTLSINKLKFTVLNTDQRFNMLNPEGLFAYLQRRQPIVAKSGLLLPSGAYEYVPMGTFYLSDWKNSTGMTATLEATDAIGLLDKTTYYKSPIWIDEPVANVVNHILSDAGYFTCVISPELSAEVINGYIPIMSHREALQAVLLAVRGALRAERDSTLKIIRPDYGEVETSIDYDTILGTPAIEQKPLVTSVKVPYILYEDGTAQEQYKTTFTLNGTQTILVPFDHAHANVSVSVTGNGTISGSPGLYACAVEVTIVGTGSLTLTVSGKDHEETVQEVIVSLPSIPAGEIPQQASIADNKLISGMTQAKNIGQYALDYFQKRIKQTFSFWDDPSVQAGDCVEVETMFASNKSGIVERQEITFAPSLKGKLEVTG